MPTLAGRARFTTRRKAMALVALAWASAAAPALAAEPPGQESNFLSDATKSAGEMARSASETMGGWWQDLTGSATSGGGPAAYLPGQISEDDKRLFAVFDAIGLKLTDVIVSNGVFSSATYRFAATREPSDDDVRQAESLLREYREEASGMRARAKQRIARATLDTFATAGFVLSTMELSLWPWPDASYHVTARSAAAANPATR
jgi:hypothetical protein